MKALKSIYAAALAALIGLSGVSCSDDSPVTVRPEGWTPEPEYVPAERGSFAKGADVSWVTEFEKKGYKFRTPAGEEMELMRLLRDHCGVNSIRLRVWVNPAEGWCDLADVVAKARRANSLGQRIMIDFHFSDTWADPGKQFIPAAWEGMNLEETETALAAHVTETLTALKNNGIEPEWVQIGNETRAGMLWPLGHTDNGDNFTRLVNAGHDAVKAIFPDAAVIVHCDCGNELRLYTYLFGKLKAEGARYDMIGMSLYPEPDSWQTYVDDCLHTIDVVKADYGKDVMICEIGLAQDRPVEADAMMTALMEGCLSRDVKGIFWWEPEAPVDYGYLKGCFDTDGAPTQALDCFKR